MPAYAWTMNDAEHLDAAAKRPRLIELIARPAFCQAAVDALPPGAHRTPFAPLEAALDDPNAFKRLVDALGLSVIVTCLRLWGVYHDVYPADPLPAPDARELVECTNRMKSAHP